MGIEATIEMQHLAQYRVGYDPYKDELTFLPFVHRHEERMNPMTIEAHPVTICGTIEALYFQRSANMAGVRVCNARSILQHNALELHARNGHGVAGLDCLKMLEFAEAYAASLAPPGTDLTARTKEIRHLHNMLERAPITIPEAVAELIA
jgi:hypothetical protein